jgi:hypothetical protein
MRYNFICEKAQAFCSQEAQDEGGKFIALNKLNFCNYPKT